MEKITSFLQLDKKPVGLHGFKSFHFKMASSPNSSPEIGF